MIYETMPFGKFKGEKIFALPSNYIIHAIEEFDLPVELMDSLRNEIANRLDFKSLEITTSTIDAIYLQLAKKYHPDKGGSNEAMQAINDFRQLVKQ